MVDPTAPPAATAVASTSDLFAAIQGVTRQLSVANQNMLTLIAAVQALQPRITGSFTLGAAASTSVAQSAVETNSKIFLTPTNAAAATLMGSAKSLYISAKTPGTGFTVATASGGNAVGTETFDYIVSNP